MDLRFTNDELFFLCLLAGAGELLGVANPWEEVDESHYQEAWETISSQLIEKGYLSGTAPSEMVMSEKVGNIIRVIAFPSMAFCMGQINENQEEYSDFIYLQSDISIHMKREDEYCMLQVFNEANDFIDYLGNLLGFRDLDQSEPKYLISINSKKLDNALAHTLKGKVEKGAALINQVSGIHSNELINFLHGFTDTVNNISVAGFNNSKGGLSEAIFSIVKNEGSTWLIRLKSDDEYEKATIFKSDKNEMVHSLFSF